MAYRKKTFTEPEVKEEVVETEVKESTIPPLPERFKGNKTIEGLWKHMPKLWEQYK